MGFLRVSDCDLGQQTVIHAAVKINDPSAENNPSQINSTDESPSDLNHRPLAESVQELQNTSQVQEVENSVEDSNLNEREKSFFYVYCTDQSCGGLQRGKLR